MIALLLLMAAEAPEAGERLLVRASARILRGETISLTSGEEAADRERNQVLRINGKTGEPETLMLVEFQ